MEAQAGLILVVNGTSTTSEAGTTAQITANLNNLLIAAGNTTVISDGVPVDLSGFSQIWDIRFDPAITAGVQTQYLSFLQAGGGMFVMGENDFFMVRNDSITSLIAAAGGGNLTFVTPASTETVNPPFNGPNPIPDGNVTFAAPGGLANPGTGVCITQSSPNANCAGVAFGVGTLANATSGALTTIFDVNFMEGDVDQPDSQNLLKNLISFVKQEVEPPSEVPEPGTLALLGMGLLGLAGLRRRNAKA